MAELGGFGARLDYGENAGGLSGRAGHRSRRHRAIAEVAAGGALWTGVAHGTASGYGLQAGGGEAEAEESGSEQPDLLPTGTSVAGPGARRPGDELPEFDDAGLRRAAAESGAD